MGFVHYIDSDSHSVCFFMCLKGVRDAQVQVAATRLAGFWAAPTAAVRGLARRSQPVSLARLRAGISVAARRRASRSWQDIDY